MSEAISSLVAALGSDQATERQAAAQRLLKLGPDAGPAAVALVEAADSDEATRDLAAASLEDMGPPPVDSAKPLAALLRRTTLDTPYWAATLLGRLEEGAAPVVPDLITAATGHPQSAVRQRAVWALGRVGPAAMAALETLEKLAADQDARLASLARDAIAKIGG